MNTKNSPEKFLGNSAIRHKRQASELPKPLRDLADLLAEIAIRQAHTTKTLRKEREK